MCCKFSVNLKKKTNLLVIRNFFLIIAVAFFGAASHAQELLTLSIGHLQQQLSLVVETARSNQQRQQGLSNRPHLPINKGMLFFFEKRDRHCLWMKDTYFPLAAAFIDDNNKVIKISQMQAHTRDVHCSTKPVKLILEAHPQWLDSVLKMGATVQIQ